MILWFMSLSPLLGSMLTALCLLGILPSLSALLPLAHALSVSHTHSLFLKISELKKKLKCALHWFLVYSQSCAVVTTIYFQNIIITPQKKLHTQ